VGGPILFGVLAGVLLMVSEPAYLVVSLLAAVGAILAGLEHRGPAEGAMRGLAGGLLFGAFILLVEAIWDGEPTAELPEPQLVLIVFTVVVGVALSSLGGLIRSRREA